MSRLALPVLLLCLLLPVVCYGQRERSYEIQKIEVEPLTNGLRIRIKADGPIRLQAYTGNFWRTPTIRSITFTLKNTRPGAGTFVEIGRYPASHLEFATPNTAGDNLHCTLVFYKSVRLVLFGANLDATTWAATDLPQVMITNTKPTEVLIHIISDRAREPERKTNGSGKSALRVSGDAARLTLHALNTDIQQVIDGIAQQVNALIYLDDRLSQRVTAHLEGLPLETVLNGLATGYGLSLFQRQNAYYLTRGTANNAPAYWGANRRNVALRYLAPDDARLMLPEPTLTMTRTNSDGQSLTLTGPTALLDKIEQDLTVLDQPPVHCLVQAWMVSVEGNEEQLRQVELLLSGGTTAVTANSTGTLNVTIGGQQAEKLIAALTALQKKQQVRIHTEPAIQVLNGKRATLFVGQDIYYWQIRSWGEARLASTRVGSRLTVQPQTAGEWITLFTRIEDNALQETNSLGPLILQRNVQTTMRIRSGDTLIIGGLQLASQDKQRGKAGFVPLWPAGDLLGRHFANTTLREVFVLLRAQTSREPIRSLPEDTEKAS
ncbi:MAG: type II secretion system protein GspD [Armatimonadota bacterium]